MTTVVDQEAMTQASCETMRSGGMLILDLPEGARWAWKCGVAWCAARGCGMGWLSPPEHAAQRRGQAHEWGFRHLTGCTAKHEGSRCTAKHEGVAAQPGASQLRLWACGARCTGD
eukprot:scaffold75533_cov80-Phaeocystis_antarctica.AAC.1